jgi:uncharacterized protein YajQ (UPF0234 family)
MKQRYDFKGSKSEIELNSGEQEFTVLGDDEFKLKAAIDILQGRLVKRGVSLKSLNYQKVEPASGGAVRQKIKIQSGIEKERCKEIVKEIKAMKIKVQAQIQDAQVRVSSAKRTCFRKSWNISGTKITTSTSTSITTARPHP